MSSVCAPPCPAAGSGPLQLPRCSLCHGAGGDTHVWVVIKRTIRMVGFGDRWSAGTRGMLPARRAMLFSLPAPPAKQRPRDASFSRSPCVPTSPYLPGAASSGVANTTILLFSQVLRWGNWAFHFQINPSDFFFIIIINFFSPAATKVVVIIIITRKQSSLF